MLDAGDSFFILAQRQRSSNGGLTTYRVDELGQPLCLITSGVAEDLLW